MDSPVLSDSSSGLYQRLMYIYALLTKASARPTSVRRTITPGYDLAADMAAAKILEATAAQPMTHPG